MRLIQVTDLQTSCYKGFPWQPASSTNPTATYYVPLVLKDPVLFHATLNLSVMRCKQKAEQWLGVNSQHLQAECIRLLRERVESDASGSKGVSDETISAVAALAASEHERGNLKMLKMHIGGLKRMIDLRGGINAIRESNPMVANSAFWIFVVAMYEVPYPAFDRVLPPLAPYDHGFHICPPELREVRSHCSDLEPSPTAVLDIDLPGLGLDPNIASVLTSIQNLSHLVPTQEAYPSASSSLAILTRMCTLLSHLLSLCRADLQAKAPSNTAVADVDGVDFSQQLSECTRLALLLHVFTPWRGLPPDGTLSITLLLHQLLASLRILISHPSFKPNVLSLWLFAAGAVAASSMPERGWVTGHLVQLTEELGIDSWETWKGELRRVMWHEQLCAPRYKLLWEEVDDKRKVLSTN
ncbi:uncharacterized protein L3040_000497 [Drepanopeziza brunnea f. sp. 'multigermtubi']|uniref:uncharacterized protein n=1 Tax=Drepanopeziza brunnea f. sp. 'multigermtubi' TaxID=698441 RepID=UPI00239B9BF7|nr:hypothetical protein L3040_000497 [Drepanopeziza brunnea f. sp. 'multigermtubi']